MFSACRSVLKGTLYALNVLLLVTFAYFMYKKGYVIDGSEIGIEYKDLIAIILTALSVIITIAGLLIAVLAIMGYSAIKDEAKNSARDAAGRWLEDNGRQLIVQEIRLKSAAGHEKGAPPVDVDKQEIEKILSSSRELEQETDNENDR